MNDLLDFEKIVGRAKKAFKIKEDKELAEIIGMSSAAFHNRKKTQSLPYSELLIAANKRSVDYNWLLTGEGSMYKNALSEPGEGYEVSLKVLYPELTEREVQMFETEIEERIEFNRLKTIVYKSFAVV